jgi:dihydrofolate synthase / folylpolyglutamate synthase
VEAVTYPDSVHFLYALGNEIRTAKLGLDRISRVLEALGRPHDKLRFLHVAGTNGKGSTCAMIESGLRAAGLRTGLFTSPHLAEPTERIRIDGEPVSPGRFSAAFDGVHRAVERLISAGEIDMHTTYFETVTAMAMTVFAEEAVDAVVLEVGLGGRLDATNVVRPAVAVITQVDFDHEAYLGRSIEAITGEKAGILKAGVPAVFARQRAEAGAVLEARAEELGIEVTRTSGWQAEDLRIDARGSRYRLVRGDAASDRLAGLEGIEIACPLAGEHQVENSMTAALALGSFGIAPDAIARGIAAARWPGRLEMVSERPEIVLDGAHNPAGARALARYIARFYAGRRIHLIYGAMRDKAIGEIVEILFPLAAEVIVTAPAQARALAPEVLRDLAGHASVRPAPDLAAALELVRDVPAEDVVFITGSLFLVAEARRRLML